MKLFKAVYWKKNSDEPGKRVCFYAEDSVDAGQKLKEMHGEDIDYTVYNEEDANRPR